MKITIYDVAKKANVSTATVSKVINETGKISEATREKVKAIINELGYRPNLIASALMTKKTATIGLLIPDITNPYFSEVARQIDDCCRNNNYSLTFCNTDNDEAKTSEYIDLLLQKGVDGLIVSAQIKDATIIKNLLEQKIPVLLFATSISDLDVNTVIVDEYAGTAMAVEHLVNEGCENICFVGGKGIERSSNKTRAYYDVIRKYGLEVCEMTIDQSNSALLRNKEELGAIFDLQRAIDGIFACSDLAAIGVLKEAQKRAIKIPEALKIVGFDNTMFTELTTPEISTVAQPIADMAKQGINLLVKNIDNPNLKPQKITFTPKLIIRGSSVEV